MSQCGLCWRIFFLVGWMETTLIATRVAGVVGLALGSSVALVGQGNAAFTKGIIEGISTASSGGSPELVDALRVLIGEGDTRMSEAGAIFSSTCPEAETTDVLHNPLLVEDVDMNFQVLIQSGGPGRIMVKTPMCI